MSYKTLEVELENGRVRPSGSETLPDKAHALLTILGSASPESGEITGPSIADLARDFCGIGNGTHTDLSTNKAALNPVPSVARSCAELADRLDGLPKLPPEEASAFADDLEKARLDLPPLSTLGNFNALPA